MTTFDDYMTETAAGVDPMLRVLKKVLLTLGLKIETFGEHKKLDKNDANDLHSHVDRALDLLKKAGA